MRSILRRLRLRALRLAFADWRGVCRLCQQPQITDEDGVLEDVLEYDSVVLRGMYHADCAIAVREARWIARHTVTR